MEKIREAIFKFLRLDGVFNHLSGYVEARIELIKLEIREEVAAALARAMVFIVVSFFCFMCIAFLSIGVAHFLNQYFHETYAGFFIVAGLYLAGLLILVAFRKPFTKKFSKHLSDSIKQKRNT
jgi:Na+/melibiose symporter-like transporter